MKTLLALLCLGCLGLAPVQVGAQCRWEMPDVPVHLTTAVWTGTRFVGVGWDAAGKVVAASTTGTDWTVTARFSDPSYAGILAWNGREFLGMIAPRAWTSADAVTWTEITAGLWALQPTFLTWAGDRYFAWVPTAFGRGAQLYSSVDGQHWLLVSHFMGEVSRVAYTGTAFVAVGGPSPSVATSLDGSSWTVQPLPPSVGSYAYLYDIAWNGRLLVAVGRSGVIVTSADGVTWHSEDSGVSCSLEAVTATADGFVCGGQDGTVLASPDGASWHRESIPTVGWVLQLISGGTRTLAIVEPSQVLVRSCESAPRLRRHLAGGP